jgi:hypothetical protein
VNFKGKNKPEEEGENLPEDFNGKTKEEKEEKDRLYETGFPNWLK